MRVVHVISNLDPRSGGPAAAVRGLVAAQADAGLDVVLLATWRAIAKPDVDSIVARGVRVELIGPAAGPLCRHPSLRESVRKHIHDADVVHIHAVWEEIQFQAARLAGQLGIPYLITPHGMLTRWSLGQKWWKKRLYTAWRLQRMLNRAAAVHFTTSMERDTSDTIRFPARSIVLPIGISLEEFESLTSPGWLRETYPQIGKRPVLVFLGRIHPGKGLEYLVPALEHVKPIDPVLLIVGPDSIGFRAKIEQMAVIAGVQNQIIFTGMLRGREKIEALGEADLFVLPSDHENFGLAAIEALAAGTPVILSEEVGVHREIVSAGVGATAPREPRALAAEITRWLTNNALRADAAARCRPFVAACYGWGEIVRQCAGIYQKLRRPEAPLTENVPAREGSGSAI